MHLSKAVANRKSISPRHTQRHDHATGMIASQAQLELFLAEAIAAPWIVEHLY